VAFVFPDCSTFISPSATLNFAPGLVVPIPTFVPLSYIMLLPIALALVNLEM